MYAFFFDEAYNHLQTLCTLVPWKKRNPHACITGRKWKETDEFVFRGVLLVQQVGLCSGTTTTTHHNVYMAMFRMGALPINSLPLHVLRHQLISTSCDLSGRLLRGEREKGCMITRCGSEEIHIITVGRSVDRCRTIREIVFTACGGGFGGLPL